MRKIRRIKRIIQKAFIIICIVTFTGTSLLTGCGHDDDHVLLARASEAGSTSSEETEAAENQAAAGQEDSLTESGSDSAQKSNASENQTDAKSESTQKSGNETGAKEGSGNDSGNGSGKAGSEDTGAAASAVIYVYVCGAVNDEGVYFLEEGDRVYKAIELAGGFRDDADTTVLNQAEMVTDGEMIRVPTTEEGVRLRENGQNLSGSVTQTPMQTGGNLSDSAAQTPGETGQGSADNSSGKVNINTATSEELQTLPGIGSSKAAQIIEYREENGGFSKPEDIMKVSGIKQGSYDKLKDKITTGN